MKKWVVEYKKYSKDKNQEVTFTMNIEGISSSDALSKAKEMGLSNPSVQGEVIVEVDENGDIIDYEQTGLN